MTGRGRARAIGLGALLFAAPLHARAGAPPPAGRGEAAIASDPSAAAEDLFRRAMQLMAAKQHAVACPLLAESYRLDPGGGTLQNLAVCYETLGRWASAYARFEELRVISKNAKPPRHDRVKLAEEHIAKIAPLVRRVVVVMPEDLAPRADVKLDGVVYQRASWSTGIAVDPGEHDLVVEAAGKQSWRTNVMTPGEGGTQKVSVPALADATPSAMPPPVVGDGERADERSAREREVSSRRMRTTGYVVGGAGLAMLAAGAVFGVLTISKNDDGITECRVGTPASDFAPNGRCYEGSDAWRRANDAKDSAETFANVANVLVPLGLVAGAVGAWLVLSHKSKAPSVASTIRVAPSFGGVAAGGSF